MKSEETLVEQRQRSYYNAIATHYDRHYHSEHAVKYRTKLFDSMLGDVDFSRKLALDAMCGGGENTAYLLQRGAKVEGIDISDEQCRVFAERYPDCKVTQGSMLETSFPSDYFDIVIVESLHHLHPQVEKGVAEIVRILKPGGLLLAWEPSAGSLLDILRKVWYRLDRRYFEDNEKSLRVTDISRNPSLVLQQLKYGGNFGYFLVFSSMHLRIPPKIVGHYANVAISIEGLLNKLQRRLLSAWFLVRLQKRV
jgi:SAM-dependent methyltransferase